jgi:hypothetical protein
LYVLDGNLTGQKYRDNVLAPRVVPHFDNHASVCRNTAKDLLNSALRTIKVHLGHNRDVLCAQRRLQMNCQLKKILYGQFLL